ncbi:CapA family protein [Streptomyces sp. H10-C2]|uniref:CapA family protein n=1 Tax=unclassified Streptomyces TaxID=2593676 RepID=UPI0024BA0862|nr:MULTISPECIES: CapA family protein [unclassified Streptomyces]MDJ0342539.1 CapA family protein [Streptomyces sp. PH10-H1]MDJ0370564.1 CapA family protein [Streptomyces sp. H10-C2]
MLEGPRARRRARIALGLALLTLSAACGSGSGPSPEVMAPVPGTPTAMPNGDPQGSVAPEAKVPSPPGTITLAFGGDVHFTERTEPRLVNGMTDPAIGPLSKTLAAADFSMVNLETAITTRGTPQAKIYHFRTPATALDVLKKSGVDAVSMANNHAVDYGAEGLTDTLAAVRDAPIPVIGIGADDTQAYRPYLATIRGVRLAVLAASQVMDITNQNWRATSSKPGIASALDQEKLVAAVKAARKKADVVVVYLHWGTEGQSCPGPEQKSIAAKLAAAGATAVVGTHAHVMLGSGMMRQTYVAYGMGNLLWYGTSPYPNSNETGITTLTITKGKVAGERFTPAVVDNRGVPMPQDGAGAERVNDRRAGLRGCTGLTAVPKK